MLHESRKYIGNFYLSISALLILMLLLVACGGDNNDNEEEVEAVVEATSVVAEEPISTEETDAALALEETEELIPATGITDTEAMTSTVEMTETESLVDDSEAMTSTVGMTETESLADDSEAMASTMSLTDTEAMTSTVGMTETESLADDGEAMASTMSITDTEAMTSTVGMTETESLAESEAMISTVEITETEEMSPTAVLTESAEISPSDDLTIAGEPNVRAEELLEYIVVNAQNETIGEIEDLIVGLESGHVPYAIVDFDEELLGLEEEFDQAIPLSELMLTPEAEAVTLNVDMQTVQNAPAFILETVPGRILPDWDIELRDYWQTNGLMTAGQSTVITDTDTMTDESFLRASDLLSYEVMNPEGEELGDIEDLVLALNSQQVKYAVLAAGGFLGLGENLYAIPFEAMVVDPAIARVVFNVDEETLENAPGFDVDNWPNTADPRWDVDTRQFWDASDVISTVPGPNITGRTIDEAGLRASQILSGTAGTSDEERVGQVMDLVVGLNSGQVKYALLSTEEDQTLVPVPFYAFVPDTAGITMAPILDEEVLVNAPTFTEAEWPDMTDPVWEYELRDYWRGAGVDNIQSVSTRDVTTTPSDEPAGRVSELLNTNINLTPQNGSATIEDLIIGLNSQHINYAIVSIDQGLVPVFFPLINFDEQGEATLEAEPGILETIPTLNPETWPEEIITPNWDMVYRNYWIGSGLGIRLNVIEASELLDRDIINLQGEGLGEIEDFVIGLNNGQISHAVIEFGGFLGFGESQVPVPMRELKIDPFRRVMILNISEESLENAAGFTTDTRPDISNPDWFNEYQAFWDEAFAPASDQADESAPQASVWASDLLDYSAFNLEGEELGEIEDAIINLQEEQLKYMLVGVGGFLGIGEKLVAVPLEVVTINVAEGTVSIDANQQKLEEAPEIDDLSFTLNTPDWDVDIRPYWSVE